MGPQIRRAQPSDLPQIYGIFEHYIQTTTSNFYYNCPPFSKVESTYEAVRIRGLPYLVAVEGSPTGSSPSGDDQDNNVLPAPAVLGYAYTTAFRDPKFAYAPSVEMSIFVHPANLHRGIGTLLMHALLDELDHTVHHAFESDHEVHTRDFQVRNVFAVMAHDVNSDEQQNSEAGSKLQVWYEKFGFQVVGRLKNVGFKYDRWVDTVYLQLDMDIRRRAGGDGKPSAALVDR